MSKAGVAIASRRRRTALMLSGAVLALVTANPALGQAVDALPTGGTVVAGLATIGTPSPSAKLDIVQSSNRAVIDWTSFDIGQNAEVAFAQPNASAIALNRVTSGAAPSQIAGKLTANGVVAVLNANGVLFAGTADVDVGGLIVSTGQIDTTAFMAGGSVLGVTGASGGEIVVSAGADITVANAGLAALVAPSVRNSGTITATAGRVQLGAGTAFTLDLASDGLLQIGVGADNPLVRNLGSVFAAGGQIQLSARQASALLDQTIRTGVLPAGTARLDGNTIVLDATGGNVQLTSEIAGRGNLTLSGSRIFGAADVNVDGTLTLNVNAGGAVADTLTGGNNWINDALGVIGAQVDATTINLGAGLYRPGTVINASNVTLDGQSAARIGWVSGIENAIDVWGDNVTVRNLEIFGPATSAYTSFAWGSTNSRGVFVNRFADNITVSNNNIHDIRTGIIVDGRNLNALITGNRLDNTKSGISIQYTNGGDALTSGLAGSSLTIAGNFEGTIGNEWGINVHLNGIWSGGAGNPGPSTSLVGGLPVGILGTASLTEQQRLVALGTANNGMAVQNIAYSAANRTRAYVTPGGGGSNVQGSQLTPFASIQQGINAVVIGGTVRIANGTYNIGNSPILIRRGLSLIGASQAGVIIDGRGVGAGLGTMQVQADNVTLSNFTLYGADSGVNNYGIKVQPNSSGGAYSPNQRLLNFAISDVTVRGSTRAELDLNGVVGATITNFTADGRRVTNDAFQSAGAGVQITDSSNITLTGVHTLGNAWGGVALYQANKSNAYNGQTTHITINAALNQFDEANGLFSQLESTAQGFGQLNLTGFNYAVRNTDHRPDDLDAQFIFYRTSLTDAVAFAKAVGTASASSIEGYTGTAFSNVFTVADGLTIGSALRDVRAGGTVNVGAGTFAETVSIGKALTFVGAGMNATSITGGMLLTGSLSDLVLRDFTVSGSGGSSVIGNSGTLTGLTVDSVRIDGLGVANRHGFTGGQIGGDISITDSEFVNIRGWAAFDTRSGAGGSAGSQIASGVFTNNLIDNTVGHIAFRNQPGAASVPDITISGNTVRNVGSATNSFGAVFKAFNADTVDFTGNNVSGVGTSGFNPAGEAAYGAVLMIRGTAVLNVTGNTFANNNQVFAVEPGRGLPGVTNFSGNSFVNNGYSIYLPANLDGAGTIQFGAGNDFTAGADTVRHVLWRSASGLDLTGVSFDGTLASELSLDEAFAVEDLITHGVDLAGFGLASLVDGELFVTTASGADAALRAIALGTSGDTLNLSPGTHTLTDTLFLTQDIDVAGQGIGATILDASGHGNWGIRVHADNVALSGLTLNGSPAVTSSSYGIKVEAGGAVGDRNTGFAITNVAIAGSRKNGLDLNAVSGAVIDGVSVTGVTAGNGISISDSANVIVRNSDTSGNAWGGLGLYQTNNLAGGGSDQQLTGITVEDSNAFSEAAGVYLQDSSGLTDPGTVSVLGYGYTVRNADHRLDGAQFTFFQKTAQNAFDYAVSLAAPGSSVVQGWAGSASDRNFHVGFGTLAGGGQQALSLQAAFGASVNGDTINVASGTYGESATLTGTRVLNFGTVVLDSLTLAAATAGNSLKGNLTLANGGFSATGPLTLTGATAITATSGNISLGAVTGAEALTLSGNGVTLGAANLASLAATSASIATAGVTTTGVQSYTGPVTLNGGYSAATFAVNGATTLGGATTIAASGNVGLGTIGGAQALTVSGNAVTLGAANIASLAATGSSIATAGVTTTGAQSYTGPVALNGSYGAASFSVTGPTTLGGLTTIAAAGNLTLGTVTGAQALGLSGTGITLGSANLASLAATGTSIATSGVTTTGTQSYTGPVTLKGNYGASAFTAGAATLGGATTIATSGSIALGATGGAQALTLSGTGISLGAANLASLTATGTNIATSGVTTTGAQSYTGPVSLAGSYGASNFTVAGATTLAGATTIAATGNLGLGTIGGAQALTVSGNAVTLGAANIASLAATGGSIATSGVTTSGNQSYTGPLALAGNYGAANFTVNGATTLGGATTIAASGNLGLGTIGGAQALILSGGAVTLGAANIASLAATGTSIVTSGVTTAGAQSYTGPVTLNGNYAASAFTVTGATTLSGAATIAASGTIGLGTVGGGQALVLNGTGIALGAANLASLAATGTNIATSGVTTAGAQSYTGAVILAGSYDASAFMVNGAATLGGATTIGTTGDIGLGTVNGAQALTLSGEAVTLGAANLGSLTATGRTIVTSGAVTTGAQEYVGETTLSGSYEAANFAVDGATTIAGDTSVSAAGDIAFGTVEGGYALALSGEGVTLGAASLASLSATGTSIATSGVITTGAQSYVGDTTLAGGYQATDFSVDGTVMLGADTEIAASGAAAFGSIDGAQDFALTAGSAALGAVGQDIRIAAMTVSADETVLTAGTYRADSMSFAGDDGATVRLTQVETIFDSTPARGPIAIASHLIGTETGQQNVVITTGTGAAGDGDIALGNAGTNAVRIGDLSVTGGDFSAATVKLAGDFTSLLGGSQVFSSQTLDTLGNVKAQVAGSESGPIVAGGAVSVTAGGSGTGSIIAAGPVELAYSNEVSRAISSQSSVSLAATGPVTGSITATGSVAVSAEGLVSAVVKTDNSATIASVAGVSSNVTAGGGVQLTASHGAVSSQVSSGGTVSVNATGAVTGSITATGSVAVNADGLISTTVKTDNSATIASVAGVSSNVTAGGGVQLTASQGAVSSQVSSGGTVNVNATGAVTGSITASGPIGVSAGGPVSTTVNTGNNANITSATGISSAVTAGGTVQVSATQGAVSGSINAGGQVNVAAAGPVSTAVSTTGGATIASGAGVSSTVNAGAGVSVSATHGAVTGSINAGGTVAVTAQGTISAAVSTTGSANVVSTSGGVSSTISAGGSVAVAAPGAVTSTISSGSTVQLTSNTPIDVQVTGGAVSVNAPGGQVSGVFGEITTDDGGTFVVNDQPVVGNGMTDARQIIVDSFLAPVGGTVGAAGEPRLPNGLALALIAPSGAAAGQRAVVVGSVASLGDLLRQGYTAIIIDIGESGLELEPEDAGS